MQDDIDIEATQIAKFSAVYAEGVLTWLDSGEAQWITWDGHSHRFDAVSVERELDDPGQLIVLTIGEHWQQALGDLEELTDPEHTHFDAEALRAAIEHQLIEEGLGERILKGYLRQLAKITAQLDDVLDADEPDE